jgi:hypothetical protein
MKGVGGFQGPVCSHPAGMFATGQFAIGAAETLRTNSNTAWLQFGKAVAPIRTLVPRLLDTINQALDP